MGASEWIALGGVGVATAAVVLSLLQEDLRRRFLPPKVSLDVGTTVFKVLSASHGRYVAHAFLRLQVTVTSTSRGAARGVQVTLISVDPAPVLGLAEVVDDPHMLRPLRWSFEHKPSVDLPAGASRYVDLLEVSATERRHAALTITDPPPEGLHLLGRSDGLHTIRISVTGENIRAIDTRIRVMHDGRWNGDARTAGDSLTGGFL
jgi:hypothetical protein